MEVIEEKGQLEEDYTQDGTVDLQGRPVLRSKTGRWKACYFLVGKMKSYTSLYVIVKDTLIIYVYKNFVTHSCMCNL